MEKLYYILDSEENKPTTEHLSYDEAIEWLIKNGNPVIHILVEV
jgi:hypothetical protein